MKLGIDVSTYFEELNAGAVYLDNGVAVDPLDMFRANGVKGMRIRLWVDPRDEQGNPYLAGTCDLEHFIKLATYAQSRGYSIMLDIHYSDFWCDPGKQRVPKSWHCATLDELAVKVYDYTKETLLTIAEHGIKLEYVQIGNEITNGILWPFGQLSERPDGSRTNYHSLKTLLKSGVRAAREVTPDTSVILHLERSYDQRIYNEFFTNMSDVDFDVIGFSYYPYWHGTFEQFFANVEMCKKFGKREMVVELGYAFTLEDYIKNSHGGAHLVVGENNVESLGFVKEYPISPEGQRRFVKDFLAQAYAHGLEGVYWWEPLWIPGEGICWATDEAQRYLGAEEIKSTRNEWANQCLFDYGGRKLPAFDEFKIK